jgi:hypothetical protein
MVFIAPQFQVIESFPEESPAIRYRTIYAIGFLLVIITGCAFGQTIKYTGVSNFKAIKLPDVSTIIAVWDRRPYVQNRDKTPQFVGLTRSLFGIPYPTHTSSGNALADDLANMISLTLKQQGKKVQVAILQTKMSNEDMIKTLTQYGKSRILLFEMHEW